MMTMKKINKKTSQSITPITKRQKPHIPAPNTQIGASGSHNGWYISKKKKAVEYDDPNSLPRSTDQTVVDLSAINNFNFPDVFKQYYAVINAIPFSVVLTKEHQTKQSLNTVGEYKEVKQW